jgi:hypothetical protein
VVECSVDINGPCEVVFDVVHDYGIRLQWDTLLSKACIVDEAATEAGVGVRTLCVGRTAFGRVGMETVYVSFDRPRVAAVKMSRGPWFVGGFAASIRHTDSLTEPGTQSLVTYKLQIYGRPRWLRFLLDPLLRLAFRYETRKRLLSLKRYVETRRGR